MKLQRQVGNRAVAAYVRPSAVQRVKEGDGRHPRPSASSSSSSTPSAPTPRLAITGHFDAATTAATKAFQKKLITEKMPGVIEDGIVAGITQAQLKLRAPPQRISGNDTVVVGPGNTQVPFDPAAGHPQAAPAGAKGVAVKELQERLNSSGAAAPTKLKVDGDFGPLTDGALKAFQTTAKLTATGSPTRPPGRSSRSPAPASQGHVEFDWREEVEGVKNVGLRAAFDWKLSKTALAITVGINFARRAKTVDSTISQWLPTSRRSGAPSRRSTSPTPRRRA